MTVITVDNTDLAAVMADAGMEPAADASPATTPTEKAADKPAADAKTDAKADTKTEGAEAEQDDADDTEDENGVTERQRRELSAKMLKAIGKKHRQVKEAEEFAADQIRLRREAEARAAEIEHQLKERQAREQPAAAKPAAEPQREDFATDAEFVKAAVKWGVDQEVAQRDSARMQTELDAGVQKRFANAMEAIPDFQRVIEANPLSFPEHMRAYVRESDMSAEICYHFAKDPQALAKVVALHPVRQLVELGKIEARLQPFGSSAGSPKAGDKPDNGKADKVAPSTQDTGFSPSKARSDAPVIKPLSSSDGAQVEVDPEKMTTRQMIEDFQKTHRVNLNARKRH